MTVKQRLRVCIVGSGLAGLAATRVIREHHDVTVFERRDPHVATGGQGIVFFPSAVKVLKSMGYDTSRARPVKVGSVRHFDKLGNDNGGIALNYDRRYGTDPWSGLRSDCRDELFRLATAPSEELGIQDGGKVKMVFNNAVIDVDPENAVVKLEDGSHFSADVVIIADGIHSRLRGGILGDDTHQTRKMGLTIYRVAVPLDDAKKQLGELPDFVLPDSEGKGCITYFQSLDDSNRLLVTYSLRDFEYVHMSLHLPTGAGHGIEIESWNKDGNREKIIGEFSDFDSKLLNMVQQGSQIKVWDMQDLDPLPYWNKDRAILIGDAAHAMTPMQGQGANMAIEDAESFRLLTRDTTRDDIPKILEKIDSIRRPRTANILNTTRMTLPNTRLADRMERMEFNNSYNGIVDALQKARVQ